MTSTSTSTDFRGASALLGGAFIIGTFGLWVRVISPMLGSAAQTTGRFGLASLLLFGWYVARRKRLRLQKRELLFAVLIGIASFGTGFLFTVAANETKIATSLALMYAGGIVSAMSIGSIFLKEKVSVRKFLAVGIALCGLAMYAHDFALLNVGLLAALGAGLCDSIAHAFRKQLRGSDRNLIVMYQYAIGGVVAVVFTLASGGPLVKHASIGAVLGLGAYALASVGLGNLLLYGFSRFDVNAGAVILATQLFFATILGAVVLHEIPTWQELAGAGLIFCASCFAALNVRLFLPQLAGMIRRPKISTSNKEVT